RSAGSADPTWPACPGHLRSPSLPAALGSGSLFCSQENSSAGAGSAAGSAVSGRLVNAASNGPRLPTVAEWFPLAAVTPGSGAGSQPALVAVAPQPSPPVPGSAASPGSVLSRPVWLGVDAG